MGSRFEIAVPILVELTHAPIFQYMQTTDTAMPMAVGVHKVLQEMTAVGKRQPMRRALSTLSRSRRYREAIINGTVRYNIDLSPAQEITESERERAKLPLVYAKPRKPKPKATP